MGFSINKTMWLDNSELEGIRANKKSMSKKEFEKWLTEKYGWPAFFETNTNAPGTFEVWQVYFGRWVTV